MPDQITQILHEAMQRNTKSTVLKSLGWLVGILSASTILASHYGLDKWLVVMFATLDCTSIVVYITAYIYFAFKDPDLLRSEKFTIQKMAIQHGIVGDDISGFIKVVKIGDTPLLADTKSTEAGKEGK
jgi:hypothetical protein